MLAPQELVLEPRRPESLPPALEPLLLVLAPQRPVLQPQEPVLELRQLVQGRLVS